jgi:uncharacterized protein with HEPN domain
VKSVVEQRILVDEIREHARLIAFQVKKGREAFFSPSDSAVRDSVEHRLELIAEAAGKLPAGFRRGNPGVAWSALIELRSMLAHPYESPAPRPINLTRVWRFAVDELPRIDRKLERPRFPS